MLMAYGRYQQAEELMRDVIKDQPNRDECKLKLLKIFYSDKNIHAFETYANELAQQVKKMMLNFGQKLLKWAGEICKDSNIVFFWSRWILKRKLNLWKKTIS